MLGKLLGRMTIKSVLTTVLIFTSLVPAVVLNFMSYWDTKEIVNEKVRKYNQESTNQISQRLDYFIDQVNTNKQELINVLLDNTIEDYNSNMSITSETVRIQNRMYKALSNRRLFSPYIKDVYYIHMNRWVFSSNSNVNASMLLNKPWIVNINQTEKSDFHLVTHFEDYSDVFSVKNGQEDLVVSFIKKVKLLRGENRNGVCQIDVKYSKLEEIIQTVQNGSDNMIIVYDDNSDIVYCTERKFVGGRLDGFECRGLKFNMDGSLAAGNEQLFVYNSKMANVPWKVISIVAADSAMKQLSHVTMIWVIITCITIIFIVLVSIIVSHSITSPLSKLIKRMKLVGEGNFNSFMPDIHNKDLQVLSGSFNSMIVKVNNLMENIVQTEKEKQLLEIKALQAQINPHFQYNTLSSIKWMAYRSNNTSIAEAIDAFIKALQYSTKKSESLISVKEELNFIKDYIYLQKMRYGDKIKILYQLDEQVFSYCILKFCLQPFVENALIHGLGNNNFDGILIIKAAVNQDKLVFNVIDDGKGMENTDIEKFSGLGINNVDRRIKLNFGESFGVDIESSLDNGTNVRIVLPLIELKEGEKDEKYFDC